MFKSASIFRIINAARITDAALQANEFTPCGPTQPHSAGWIPPRPGSAGLANMAETVAGQTILLARIETRTVPGPALKKALAETCAKLEAEQGRKVGKKRTDPFDELYIRTWRDLARYRGSEALGQEGPQALMRLPWLMEEILEAWEVARKRPQFKAE